ncbi:hypothetical protein JXR93_03330, partial [bacterium]|nr:hypothetical protein [bacterium]
MRYIILFSFFIAFLINAADFDTGKKYCQEKSYKLCKTELESFLKTNPKTPKIREINSLLAKAYIKLREYNRAFQIFQKFEKEAINDKIAGEIFLDYSDYVTVYYGLYDSKWSKKNLQLLKNANQIGMDKKIIIERVFKGWEFLMYYTYDKSKMAIYSEYDAFLKKLLKSDDDYARYYFKKGVFYQNGYDRTIKWNESQKLAISNWEKVIKEFPKGKYYNDSILYLSNSYSQKQDFISALKILEEAIKKTLVTTSFYITLGNRVAEIKNPRLNISNNYTFLPNNKPSINLSWRNIDKANFKLYKISNIVDVLKKNSIPYNAYNLNQNLHKVSDADLKEVKSWEEKLIDKKDYKYQSKELILDVLPAGTYILKGESKGIKTNVLINVTENAIVLKVSPDKGLVYVTHAMTGEPIINSDVLVSSYRYNYTGRKYETKVIEGKTDDSGVFAFDIPDNNLRNYYSPSLQAISEKNGNVAMTSGYGGYY